MAANFRISGTEPKLREAIIILVINMEMARHAVLNESGWYGVQVEIFFPNREGC